MGRRKDPFWQHAKDLKNRRFLCNYCGIEFSGGISRFKSHLSGVKGRDIEICEKVEETIQLQARDAISPSKRAKNVAASNDTLKGKSCSGSSSLSVYNLCEGQDKSTVDQQLAKFLVSEGIHDNLIRSPFFQNFVNGVAKHGPSYKLLYCIRSVLATTKEEVEKYVENVKKESIKTGCTLMYKKRSKREGFLLDIFACTAIGAVYIKSLEPYSCNSQLLDYQDIFSGLETTSSSDMDDIGAITVGHYSFNPYALDLSDHSVMEVIRPENVVQFFVDIDVINPTEDKFCRAYPWISLTQHDYGDFNRIYDIPVVNCTIVVARWIVLYIDKYKVNVSLRREHKSDDNIASDVFKLMSLLEVESKLQTLEVSIGTMSNEWGKKLNNPQIAKFMQETRFIDYAINSKEFWRQGKIVAQVMHALVQANCLIHHVGPTLGYLYEMMERVQDAVEQCRESNVLYDDIRKFFKAYRSGIIHPIHAAAAFLNPIYMCSEKFKETDEIKKGVNYILEHLVAVEEKEDFKNKEQLYRMKDSNVFTAEAVSMLKTYHPRIWWERYGTHVPVLQKYAIRILSQPCSSSICQGYQLANDYDDALKWNTLMMEKCKSLEAQSTMPIVVDKLVEVSHDPYDRDDTDHLLSSWSSSVIDDIINDDMLNDPSKFKLIHLNDPLKDFCS